MALPPIAPGAQAALMAQAISEARKGIGRTHPNPSVGAIIVRDGVVVGRGFTLPAGQPHAEAEALRDARERARGADLFVTLEPCNHYGRQPPCTEAIIAAGIARVFIGSIDPNPRVSGRGIQRLKEAGIEVTSRILEAECDAIIRPFRKHITTGRPFVVLKAAATLDGKLATRTGDSKWISGEMSRQLAHVWRDEFDAVLVGAGTLRADDPQLTTRLESDAVPGRRRRNPIRVVLAGSAELPASSKLFDTSLAPTVLATAVDHASKWSELASRGVEVLPVPSHEGRVEIPGLLDALGRRGITSVLVEGGSAVHAAFLRSGLVDEVRLFLAPRIAGGDGLSWVGPLGVDRMPAAWRLLNMSVERVGTDLLLIGQPAPPEG